MSNYHVFHFFNFVTIWITLIFGGLSCLEKKKPKQNWALPPRNIQCVPRSIHLTHCVCVWDNWHVISSWKHRSHCPRSNYCFSYTFFVFKTLNKELSCSEVWWMMSQTFSSAVIRTRLIYHSLLNICRLQVLVMLHSFFTRCISISLLVTHIWHATNTTISWIKQLWGEIKQVNP